MKEWKRIDPTAEFFYRKKNDENDEEEEEDEEEDIELEGDDDEDEEEVDDEDEDNGDDDDDDDVDEKDIKSRKKLKNSLLFVYQTKEMRQLLSRYGNELCLLDATYKTTRYAIPLFFLVVKTNIDYQVVGVFVTESETCAAISEALSVIRDWNPDFKPRYMMTDYDVAEIKAGRNVFGKGWFIFNLHTLLECFVSVYKPFSGLLRGSMTLIQNFMQIGGTKILDA